MDPLLIQAAVFLGAAVVAVPLAARLGLGSVLGFLGAGLVIGPGLGLLGVETEALRHFGEYGIAVMLFLVGLEVSPRALWDLRHRLLGLGGLQILLTTTAFAGVSLWLGHAPAAAVAIGMVLALSSTAIVVQTLSEKRLIDTDGGRSSFAVLLTQDVAVIPMLAVLPFLAGGDAGAEERATLVADLPAWAATAVTLGAVAAVVLTGHFVTRPVFRWIGQARLREIDTALALFIVVSTAVLMEFVGLSAALGTFVAGVVLAGSEFRHELESDLAPFKGLLLGLFFIGIGAGVDLDRLLTNPMGFAAMAAGVIAVKAAILWGLGTAFRLTGGDRRVLALGLAQGGEFGFVLVSYALTLGVLGPSVVEALLLVIALSMLATPLLFLVTERTGDRAPAPESQPVDARHPVIVAGAGRFGRNVHRLLRSAGHDAVLLDNDMAAIETLRAMGRTAYLGDPTRAEVLDSAGLSDARVLVAALDDPDLTTRLVTLARRRRPDLRIIARAEGRAHAHALSHAGADEVLREVFASSVTAGRHALEALGTDPEAAQQAERAFTRHEREALRELAGLWRPDEPADRNAPYLARIRELEAELEEALGRILRRPQDRDGR